jgi:hypothetical protein
MANDLLVGNKHIPKMYFGNKVVACVYFGNKLIWPNNTQKTLVAGTQYVSFEFIPTEDITFDHITIFTDDTYDSTTVNFAIFHESGLVVAKTNVDTAQSTEEKYGLTGQRRIVTVNGILKRGLKYYIQYTDQNGNTIHPAYFQNSQSSETGETGKYKVFTHNQAQNKSIADLSNVSSYIGVVSDINNFINASTGALMIAGSSFDNYRYTQNYAYIRNSSYHESCQNIGTGSGLTLSLLDTILNLNDGTMFYWNGWDYTNSSQTKILWSNEYHRRIGTTYSKSNYKGILTSRAELLDPSYEVGDYGSYENGNLCVYRKKNDVEVDTFIDLTDKKYNNKENYKTADIIKASYDASANASANKSVMTQGEIKGTNVNAYVFTLKTGYTYDFTVDNDGTLHGYTTSHEPSQWIQNCIYYLEESGNYPGTGYKYAPAGLNLWTGSEFKEINVYNYTMSVAFNIQTDVVSDATEEISLANIIQELGNTTIFRSNEIYDTNYISEGLRSASIEQDTKKFYLEINGDEK